MDYTIYPPYKLKTEPVEVSVSKSMMNRAIIINAMQNVYLNDSHYCKDIEVMRDSIKKESGTVNIGACGTAMRFLTAYFANKPGVDVILDGDKRMRERPIGELVNKLVQMGAEIEYLKEAGFPPLKIRGKQLSGGIISFGKTASSQFISAIMLIAPTLKSELRINFDSKPGSMPYIKMTLNMMRNARAIVTTSDSCFIFRNRGYRTTLNVIESDWSSASYWYELAALTHKVINIENMTMDSMQGDRRIVRIFSKLGVRSVFEGSTLLLKQGEKDKYSLTLNLEDNPDIAQTLMVTCCCLGVPFCFVGLESLRVKETDRLSAMQKELRKLGFCLYVGSDWVNWDGTRKKIKSKIINTYKDHRMAMAFAPASVMFPGLTIRDVDVVAKSYPDYWINLQSLGFRLLP